MSAPMYLAMGGVIFIREHAAITLERARQIEGVHKSNAAFWLSLDTADPVVRLKMAKAEGRLAEEMAAAIAEITGSERRAA